MVHQQRVSLAVHFPKLSVIIVNVLQGLNIVAENVANLVPDSVDVLVLLLVSVTGLVIHHQVVSVQIIDNLLSSHG